MAAKSWFHNKKRLSNVMYKLTAYIYSIPITENRTNAEATTCDYLPIYHMVSPSVSKDACRKAHSNVRPVVLIHVTTENAYCFLDLGQDGSDTVAETL